MPASDGLAVASVEPVSECAEGGGHLRVRVGAGEGAEAEGGEEALGRAGCFVLMADEPRVAAVLTGPFQQDAALFDHLLQLNPAGEAALGTRRRDVEIDWRLWHGGPMHY